MFTVGPNKAMARVTILALVLGTWPLLLKLQNDSTVELCLLREEISTGNLIYFG